MKIGPELKNQREFVGISLVQISKIAGCTTRTMRAIEDGDRDLPTQALLKILDALGLAATDFFAIIEGYETAETFRDIQAARRSEYEARKAAEDMRDELRRLRGRNILLGKENKRLKNKEENTGYLQHELNKARAAHREFIRRHDRLKKKLKDLVQEI